MYVIQEEDIDNAVEQSSTLTQSSPIQMQLPVLELLKVCVYYFEVSHNKYSCLYVFVYDKRLRNKQLCRGALNTKLGTKHMHVTTH